MLQAEENGTNVRTHLKTLLETSHQWPKQREVRLWRPLSANCLTLTTRLA